MKRTGTVLVPGPDFEQSLRHVQLADELGYDSVWVTHNTGRDGFVVLTAYGRATKRIGLGTDIIPLYSRHPTVMAQQALSVNDICRGRFRLGIGTSHRPSMETALGLDMGQPLEVMREYVEVVRQVFAGPVHHHGPRYDVEWEYLMPRHAPQLLIAALGPRMVELAAEIADGVLLWLATPEYVRDTVVPRVAEGRRKAGKPLEGFEIICPVPAAVTDDDAAWQSFRTELVRYCGLPFYQQEFRHAGLGEELDAFLRDRNSAGEPWRAVPERLARALGAVGSAADVAALTDRFVASGVTLPLIRPVHTPSIDETLRAAQRTIG